MSIGVLLIVGAIGLSDGSGGPPILIADEQLMEMIAHLEKAKTLIRNQQAKRIAELHSRAMEVRMFAFELEGPGDDPEIVAHHLGQLVRNDPILKKLFDAEARIDREQSALASFNDDQNYPLGKPSPTLRETWRYTIKDFMREAAERAAAEKSDDN